MYPLLKGSCRTYPLSSLISHGLGQLPGLLGIGNSYSEMKEQQFQKTVSLWLLAKLLQNWAGIVLSSIQIHIDSHMPQ